MEVVALYRDVLTSLGLIVDDDGTVRKPIPDTPVIEVGDKPLMLPTDALLRENDWSKIQPFHPLCEDVTMGQSQVIHFLLRAVKASIASQANLLMKNILEVAHKPELQEITKDPKMIQVLEHCKLAKASTYKSWQTISNRFGAEQEFLNLYLKHGGEIDGEKYYRVCTLDIPMLADTDDDGLLFGVKVSKNDKRTILELLTWLFEPIKFQIGSNDTVPYFHALMMMYVNCAKQFNKIGKIFKRATGFKPKDLDWAVELADLKQYVGLIPKLPGNEGVKTGGRKKESVENKLYDKLDTPVREIKQLDDNPPWSDEKESLSASSTTPPPSGGGISLSTLLKKDAPQDDRTRDYSRDTRPPARETRGGVDLLGGARRDDRGGRRDEYNDRNREYRDERRAPDTRRAGGIQLSDLGVRGGRNR